MDDPSPSWLWWLALAGAFALHALTAFARVTFRLVGPVSLEALVDRLGASRTEFLRKSFRAPSAFWFSLSLATTSTFLLLLVVLFAGRLRIPVADGGGFALRPTGSVGHDALLFLGLLAAMAGIEFVLPVLAARLDREAVVERGLPFMRAVHFVFSPLTKVLAGWLYDDAAEDDDEPAEEELDAYIDVGEREGILEEGEGKLLRNLVEFGDTRVYEVMTARTDVVGIDAEASVRDLVALLARCRHSRIPVHRGHLDEVVGVVTLKDAVQALEGGKGEAAVTSLVRPPLIVPDSKRVAELLRELQARRQQMAIVVDEFGGTAGLVTVEDLLEELVGEIREEHEEGETADEIRRDGDGSWLVLGRASLSDLEDELDVDFDLEDASSVGGLVLALSDRVPSPGEAVERAGHRFEVLQADRRRVKLVRVKSVAGDGEAPLPPAQGGAAT